MDKSEIAEIFEEIANLLELKGENPFRVRAYRNGARTLLNCDRNLEELIREGKVTELEGIGEDLADKIAILAAKGQLPFYEKLKKSVPRGILALLQIHGLGPKKVTVLYKTLKIRSIDGLKKACLDGKIAKLKGFGTRTEKNILDAIGHREVYQQRHLWWDTMKSAKEILTALSKVQGVKRVELAGSLRRKLETVGDLDLLVASTEPRRVTEWFISQPFVERVLAKGETKTSVRFKEGMQVDLRIVPENQFGFALCYFTGSKEHNIKIRERSLKKGWSLSEYGFEAVKGRKTPFSPSTKNISEADIYHSLGLDFIPPELRENRGEIESAAKGGLPVLIEERQIRGTFHNHTTASDGRSSLKDMIAAAEKLGWEYLGISDHSKSSVQANGLSEERLLAQIEEIRKLNASKKLSLHLFAGTECDILANGSLDFSDGLLKQLDFVIVSVHSSLSQDEKTMTQRIIRAIEHPFSTMVGHLTGRLLLKREAYAVNIQKVIDACIANKKIIELNGNPRRLDMDWRFWRKAADKGLLCCINTDAHAAADHAFYQAGVNIARKGWLEKQNVINTRPLKEILKFLRGC